ncbi:MAG: DUF2955 domain-containing protein [gamma proteobacterium symbiont of Bathyaustriella thionipta]|nr:DUF2955 domain-containing protein [gamma proteobacterium symbiont of Bathyaustriella thionipta]
MPTEILSVALPVQDIASRRIFRLAFGTALSLLFSQMINWPMSFIAPVFSLFILALPLPAPSLAAGIKFVLALVLSVYAGMLLLPFFESARWAGILLLVLALYGCFYYTAKGGSKVLGMFMTLGLTFVVTIGSVSIDALLGVAQGLSVGALSGIAFVWLAHALFPELPRPAVAVNKQAAQSAAAKPSAEVAKRSAMRAMLIVLPLALWFLFSSSSAAYVVVMIKVATMGQQASSDVNRAMGRSLLESTLWGGLAAVIGWQMMSIMPSLLLYGLLIVLAGLLFGARIFQGAAMHAKSSMWSYAFLTMIVILAPALLDSQAGSDAGASFYSRLMLFVVIALYGTLSVAVFDAFWPNRAVISSD